MNSVKRQKTQLPPDPAPRAGRDFVSAAAHDLREPLRAIRAYAQRLATLSENGESNRREQCVQYIHEGVDRMEGLIRDLEDFCLEEMRELDPREMSMESALLEARRQVSPRWESCDARLTNDPLPRITGDLEALATVFRILLDNACKFRAAAPLRVHVTAAREGRGWIFSVQDNGQGFDPVYADLIFKPFERLHGKRYPGSGLGLPLARSIVERHGGRIWAESIPEVGSTFRFALK